MKPQLTDSTRVSIGVYRPNISIIQKIVSDHYGLKVEETQKHKRNKEIVKARRMIYFLTRKLIPNCPLRVIGYVVGNGKNFDHTSVIHSYTKIKNECELKSRDGQLVYPEIAEEISILRSKVVGAFVAARAEPSVKRCPVCHQIII